MKNFQQTDISINRSNTSNANNVEDLNTNTTKKLFTTREIISQEYFYNYYGTNIYSKFFNTDS